MECIFCKIANKEIPADVVYEDEKVMAFKDLNPQAPIHVLIIPKNHISSLMELPREDTGIAYNILNTAKKLARELGISESGFRIVNNNGDQGGQTVDHLHFHLLGGRAMQWPPG